MREVIVHGHHYTARLQRTIESARGIDGPQIVRSAAESVFAEHALPSWDAARDLYQQLGLGTLSAPAEGCVEAPSSHVVEGWNACFAGRTEPVCTLTEGFLAGAHHAITGETVTYRETACRIAGAPRCRFERQTGEREPIARITRVPYDAAPSSPPAPRPRTIDAEAIARAVASLPLHGNAEGLIPAFGSYLARLPADFYNLLCIRFVEQMSAKGLGRNAQRLLVSDAETSAIATFRAIASSAEWARLVAPHLRETPDKIEALVAITRAFGWGAWQVTSQHPGETLTLESSSGYEARGVRELRGPATDPQCFLLRGAAAGLMALVYGAGTAADRFGTFTAKEVACIARDHAACRFEARRT